ncbi:type III pantothenate kinase [Ekhidna lutea]|uniref:Type III pantothenate kinase n=1 Tax=Ekhidna lutea TaxID=447679 RepID=A0A239IFP5_EKHLU|nr:type III pantothenate kinase [Ekhidna lutea]SNS92242.1 type III pantothenate kinase [Ekhidna lutea]
MDEKIEVLLVDVGNSSIKTTGAVGGTFQDTKTWTQLADVLDHYSGQPMMVSSVKKLDPNLEGRKNTTILSHKIPLPITLDYETPETLGADRIAAAVGAHELFPNNDNLIIDMGTCMTIDLLDKSGVFRGGIISPGLKMRMTSMSRYTDQLPDISDEWREIHSGELGKTTKECLFSGSFWGIIHEINGVIKTLSKDFTSLNMILTGGDAHFFESNLKAHIFAGSKIVQKGLYRIWKYQE